MTFGIRGNKNKLELPFVALQLIKDLNKKKISHFVEKNLANLISKKLNYKVSGEVQTNGKELVDKSDLIISIGGDGTFLSTAKLVGNSGKPIIGVNLGKLGFLAETPTHKIIRFIEEIINGKYHIEERTVLQANCESKTDRVIYGLNEIVVHQIGTVKTIEIQAYFNDQLVINYLADGLIISTPTGSTGYALSAGGPIVNPKSDVVVLAPMCPHTLTARPLILPDAGIFKIKVISKVPIVVTADGISKLNLDSPAIIYVKKAPYKIKLAKRLGSNYFKVLNQKLLWGEDVRKNKRY